MTSILIVHNKDRGQNGPLSIICQKEARIPEKGTVDANFFFSSENLVGSRPSIWAEKLDLPPRALVRAPSRAPPRPPPVALLPTGDRPAPAPPHSSHALTSRSVTRADQLERPNGANGLPNGASAAATAEDRVDQTRAARMSGSPPRLSARTRRPNGSRSCMSRTCDRISRSHRLTNPKDLLCGL